MGTEDVKVTAMNMYKYKERLRLYKRGVQFPPCSSVGRAAEIGFNSHPGQSFSLSLCGSISISRANAHMVHMG